MNLSEERLAQYRKMIEVIVKEYELLESETLLENPLTSWPPCLDILSPTKFTISSELPECLLQVFHEKGIESKNIMNLPIRNLKVLGECNSHFFPSCPNCPDYWTWDSVSIIAENDEPAQMQELERILKYTDGSAFFWVDFDLVDGSGKNIPLRMVYNLGNGDANEGYWGSIWHREDKRQLADILSTGDCETTIGALPEFVSIYTPYKDWSPIDFDGKNSNEMFIASVKYKNDHQLEKVLHLGLILVEASRV